MSKQNTGIYLYIKGGGGVGDERLDHRARFIE